MGYSRISCHTNSHSASSLQTRPMLYCATLPLLHNSHGFLLVFHVFELPQAFLPLHDIPFPLSGIILLLSHSSLFMQHELFCWTQVISLGLNTENQILMFLPTESHLGNLLRSKVPLSVAMFGTTGPEKGVQDFSSLKSASKRRKRVAREKLYTSNTTHYLYCNTLFRRDLQNQRTPRESGINYGAFQQNIQPKHGRFHIWLYIYQKRPEERPGEELVDGLWPFLISLV